MLSASKQHLAACMQTSPPYLSDVWTYPYRPRRERCPASSAQVQRRVRTANPRLRGPAPKPTTVANCPGRSVSGGRYIVYRYAAVRRKGSEKLRKSQGTRRSGGKT